MSPLTNTPNAEILVEGNTEGNNPEADSMNINHHDLGPTIGYSEEPESTQEDHNLSPKSSESSENGVGDVPMANFGRPSRPHVGGPSKPKPKPRRKEQ